MDALYKNSFYDLTLRPLLWKGFPVLSLESYESFIKEPMFLTLFTDY